MKPDDFDPSDAYKRYAKIGHVPPNMMQTDDFFTDTGPSTRRQTIVAVAMILASALYLSGVFTAGLMLGNRTAWLLALATMGICYLTALVQLAAPNARTVALALTAWSILLGFIAGLVLLVW